MEFDGKTWRYSSLALLPAHTYKPGDAVKLNHSSLALIPAPASKGAASVAKVVERSKHDFVGC